MNVMGVDGVTLGVEDIDLSSRFFENFGLTRQGPAAAARRFHSADETAVELRSASDAALPPPVAGGSTIREIVWGVPDAAELEKIAGALAADRTVTEDGEGTIHSLDDDGYGIAFRVTRRQAITPAPNLLNIYGAKPNRLINRRMDFLQAVRPAAIAHVVLMTPDVESAVRFYVDRLGFRITDRFASWEGAFLRSAGSPYHHNLFLIRGATRGLHHIAFAVTDFNEVVLGGQEMLEKGWQTKLGPGRHVIGSNYFWYFQSPCGGAMELTADMDRADDSWQPGTWEYKPENTMAWSMDFRSLPGQGKNGPIPESQ